MGESPMSYAGNAISGETERPRSRSDRERGRIRIALRTLERIVDLLEEVHAGLRARRPGHIEVLERIHRDHLRLGLALLDELADPVARGLHHLVVGGDVRLLPQWAMADDHLGLVVDELEPGVRGTDHAPDVAAVADVGL